jgi:flagellar biosynthetic protein FlhB
MPSNNEDRTEAPTGKRRKEARDKGQVARSPDLSSAVVLGTGFVVLVLFSGEIAHTATSAMTTIFSLLSRPRNVISGEGLKSLEGLMVTSLLKTVAPIALVCMGTGILLSVLQVGFHVTPKAARPDISRLNPRNGIQRLIGTQALFELAKSIVKLAVVGGCVAIALVPDIKHLGASVGTPPEDLVRLLRSSILSIAIHVVAAYLLIGFVDYFWQRHSNEKALKMTKQEVKDEARQSDLPPEVKGAIRRRQRAAARARMMAAVPRADVIVTNPTHYAVAIEYSGDHPAPVVVAKGQNLIAQQIRKLAEEHEIPIVPNPPLARELYRSVEIDQMIPADMYAAVAQVLAFVYRLAARKRVSI